RESSVTFNPGQISLKISSFETSRPGFRARKHSTSMACGRRGISHPSFVSDRPSTSSVYSANPNTWEWALFTAASSVRPDLDTADFASFRPFSNDFVPLGTTFERHFAQAQMPASGDASPAGEDR